MRNIIFISFEFPPLNIIGSQRPLKFVKYLRNFNINPIVITLSPDSYSAVYGNVAKDFTLLKELSNEIKVYTIRNSFDEFKKMSKIGQFFKLFVYLAGVEHKGWFKNYKIQIADIVKLYKPSVIMVSAPPFSIIKSAIWTSKKFNIPLIIDMRDPWTLWRTVPYQSYIHYLITKYQENYFFSNAKFIIATSKQTQSDFKKIHKKIDINKIKYIPNGYDNEIQNFNVNCNFHSKNKIEIGYVGNFYYSPETRMQMMEPWWRKKFHHFFQFRPRIEDWLYRSPYFFFKAISELFKDTPSYSEIIKIKFAGNKPSWLEEMVKEFKLEDNFQHLGYLSLEDSFAFQKKCDILLITSSKVVNGRDYSIAGKTFEYFSFQKPILAFVTEGAQKDILIESGVSIICNPDNIKDTVAKMKLLFDNKFHLNPNELFLKSLNRKHLTNQLANIIYEIVNQNK